MKKLMKRTVATLLAIVLCVGLLPMAALAANGPNTANDGAAAYVYIGAQGDGTTLYSSDAGATIGTVAGASYSSATNTLTLTSYSGADKFIETNMMGDDFKIELVGSNTIGRIAIWGWEYGASLSLVGSGSLNVNPSSSVTNGGLLLYGENSNSKLSIADTVTLTANGTGSPAVYLSDTTASSGGIVSGSALPSGAQIKSQQNPATVTIGYTTYPLYTKTGSTGQYSVRLESVYNNGTLVSSGYVTYSITGNSTDGYTATVIDNTTLPQAIPADYTMVPGSTYDWYIADASGNALTSVSISPSGAGGIPTITTASLPSGTVGNGYTAALEATPAVSGKSITWDKTSGSLPSGLTLNADGTISGTPTAAGSFSFVARATEADGGAASCVYTVSIAARIEATDILCESGTYYPNDKLAVTVPISTTLGEADTMTLTIAGTGASGNASTEYAMTRGANCFYCYAAIPSGITSITQLSVSGTVKGQAVTKAASIPVGDIDFGGTLAISFTGGSTADLAVKTSDGTVFASYPNYQSGTALLLPADTYTVSFSGYASGRGTIKLANDLTAVVEKNSPAAYNAALASTATTLINPTVKFSDSEYPAGYWSYTLNWYKGNGPDKTLLSHNQNYYLLSGEDDIYVQAVPCSSYSALYDESALTLAAANLTLTMPEIPSITVSGSLYCIDPNTPATTVSGNGYVTVDRPSSDGGTSSYSNWGSYGSYTLTNVTAGSVITFSPYSSSGCDPVSYTVTQADVNAGSLTKDLTAPLSVGTINFSTISCVRGDSSSPINLYSMRSLSVTKGGVALPFRYVGHHAISIEDGIADGDTVSITLVYGGTDEFPEAAKTITATVSSAHLNATVPAFNIELRGNAYVHGTNAAKAAAALLIYDSAGQLLYTHRNMANAYYNYPCLSTPSLVAGSYSAYMVQQDYLDTLEPESYKQAPSFASGTFTKTDFSVSDGATTDVEVVIPSSNSTYGAINYATSGLEMSQNYAGTATIDLTAALKTGAVLGDGDVTITIATNQTGGGEIGYGYVNTRALSINGKAVEINRFGGGGKLGNDGTITITLTEDELASYGGFPLTISAVVNRVVYDALSAKAYISYNAYDGYMRYSMIGSFAETSPAISLETPLITAEDSFTVYGNTSANADVAIYVDGMRAASVKSDSKGYYTSKIVLNNPAEFDEFTITAASGTSVSEAQTVVYAATAASIKKITIFWMSHNGQGYQSMPVWENGAATSMYKAYYRGATNAESDEKIYWEIEFNNPDEVGSVLVNVPRNGETVQLSAKRSGSTAVYKTEPYFFYGSAPSGMYITYTGTLTPSMSAEAPLTSGDFTTGVNELNTSGVISGMSGTVDDFSFTIKNDVGGSINASMQTVTETWDANELTQLQSLSPVAGLPDYILAYKEGYLADTDGYWGTYRLCRYNSGAYYQREIYTLSKRIITTWDVANSIKTTSTLTLGSGGCQVSEYSGYSEDMKAYYRTEEVHDVWDAFFSRLADAVLGVTGGSSSSSLVGDVAEKADGIAQDSYTWAEGAEINATEIRKFKDFLDDNPCLVTTMKAFNSAGGDNPYRVVNEINAVYWEIGIGWIEKMISTSTTVGTGSAKDVMDIITDGAKDFATDYAKGKIFYRQSENLAFELYQAAKKAEMTETGVGGLCREGINWSRFPTDLYDYKNNGAGAQRTPNYPQGRYDPAGYIYEAVPSNRVSGATVELYTYDGGAVFADAEDMGIEPNPQTTGLDGRYQWFVPEGYWQVHVSKAGYTAVSTGESAEYGIGAELKGSEYWMPVLPVQLDVNIALVSYEAPTVATVSAASDGVYVTFSKYMDAGLAAAKFKINGQTLTAVTPVDAEAADATHIYARTFKLSYPAGVDPSNGDTVNIYIDKTVASYAGTSMAENYVGTATVAELAKVQAPAASIASGEVALNTAVTLSTATDGAVIYYTTDGSVPTASSVRYTGSIIIDSAVTIKAIAIKPAMRDSDVMTASYTVPVVTPGTPSSPIGAVSKITGPGANMEKCPDITVEGPGKVYVASDCTSLTFIPDEGCHLETLTVNGDIVQPNADGTYTLPYPCPCHVVKAVFKTGEATKQTYSDVSETDWFYPYVNYVTERGLLTGIGDGKFAPKLPMTRAMLVTVLWRLEDEPAVTGSNPFTDVPDGQWYTSAVVWAAENEIVSGYGAGLFGPSDNISREQMAAVLYRYAEFKGCDVTARADMTQFADSGEIHTWAADAMSWANACGLITGKGGGILDPQGNATRAEVAAMLQRFCENII